jgi:hypothetical protein
MKVAPPGNADLQIGLIELDCTACTLTQRG